MIILTSSVASVAEHIFENHLKNENYKSVLFIDTAAELEVGKTDDDDAWLIADLRSLEALGYCVERYSVTNQTKEEIAAKCGEFDIIYMCGGNTLYLLLQLQKTGAFDVIKQLVTAGKPYIGTSAGSQIAGPRVPVYIEDAVPADLTDLTGFNFTNVFILPHWGSGHFRDIYLQKRLIDAYTRNEPPFLVLSDTQFALVGEEGEITVFDTI